MKAPANHTFDKVQAIRQDLINERSEWESNWRDISDFLLPGRGIYQTYSKPRKRKLTTTNIINSIGEDSLYILTSGLHGRLTSPAMPWFRLSWSDPRVKAIEPLVQWLQQCENILHESLHASNFYSVINSFYIEYAGFGTGCMYVGEDTDTDDVDLRFELLTAGEYSFSLGPDGRTCVFIRTIFMSPRQVVLRFPDTASSDLIEMVNKNQSGIDKVDLAVLEYVVKENYQDKEYMRLYYEITGTNRMDGSATQKPLEISGFYEHPYPIARWGTIGSDVYGIGPGSRALPDIKRLQEMEKAFLMATHKSINPPLNIPGRLKGKINKLPGGENYYGSNPQEVVTPLYAINFDYAGVGSAVERVEQRIGRNFYNDVFMNAMRDPNASPLRTGQVQAMEQEKMFRLGPVVERLQSEFFIPTIMRCFRILQRKDKFPLLDPALQEQANQIGITLTSPLAVAQKTVKSHGTDSFMAFLGQAAQFDPTILDNIDVDEAARQKADIEGVDIGILRPIPDVEKIRADRAAAEAARRNEEQQVLQAQQGIQAGEAIASTRKTQAEAGQILAETQETNLQAGLQ